MPVDAATIVPTLVGAAVGFASAVFAEPLRRWLYRPVLVLGFGNGSEHKARTLEKAELFDPEKSAVPIHSTHEAEYLRIKVINTATTLAKACRAYLVRVEKQDAEGKFGPTLYCDSIPLAWSCRDQDAHGPLDLPNGVAQFVDLISTRSISSHYRVEVKPLPFRYVALFQEHGTFRFTVQVSGENVKPVFLSIIFVWKGVWNDYGARADNDHSFGHRRWTAPDPQ